VPPFELRTLTNYSDQSILEEMRRVATLHSGSSFSLRAFSRCNPKVSFQTILQRYGTWRKALDAAGLSHLVAQRYTGTRYTDGECLENLAVVWTHCRRQPRVREMNVPPSCVGSSAYLARWITWRGCLEAFVKWANSDDQSFKNDEPQAASPTPGTIRVEEDRREVRSGLRFRVFTRDGFRCVACGRSPATHYNVELHADHAVSVHDGGKTTFENLQTLCRDCNLGKGRTSL
jgi:hypothetical protein